MTCSSCQTTNDNNANFCKHCGTRMIATSTVDMSDWFIVASFVYAIGSSLARYAVSFLMPSWYSGGGRYIMAGINVLSIVTTILLSLAVRNSGWRVACIVMAVILSLITAGTSIQWLIP